MQGIRKELDLVITRLQEGGDLVITRLQEGGDLVITHLQEGGDKFREVKILFMGVKTLILSLLFICKFLTLF